MIPAARGLSGKVILAEKHPFRSQRGVVIAIAPLAGLRVSSKTIQNANMIVYEIDPAGSKENSPETFKTEEEIYYGS